MSRIDELIAELCPDGVEFRAIGEVGSFSRGGGPQKKDFIDEGVGCIHYGQIYTHYGVHASETNVFVADDVAKKSRKAQPGDVIIAVTGENDDDLARGVAWLGERAVAVSNHTLIFSSELDPKYFSYFLRSRSFDEQKRRFIMGTKVRSISAQSFDKIRIPVPPLEVQREIVRILDQFTELEAKLEAELEARRRQYTHFRSSILTSTIERDVHWATLGEISSKVSSGGTPSTGRKEYYGGDVPWLRTQEVDFTDIKFTSVKITEAGLKNSSAKWIPANCVIVAMYGATGAKVAINSIPLTTNQACCNLQIDPEQAEYRYVFHWIANEYLRLRALGEGSQANLNAKKVKEYPIIVPSLERQREIVAILDKFDALVNDLSVGLPAELAARRKQYEYYRDRLLTFKELAA